MQASHFKGKLEKHYPLTKLNTWRIGGSAQQVFWPASIQELIDMVKQCRNNQIPIHVIGRGSNVLFPDEGIKGMVIVTTSLNLSVWTENGVRVEAGYSMMRLAREAADKGLMGLEFACGIPGTVGAGIVINAGAHGEEMSELVDEVKILTTDNEVQVLKRQDMEFTYRHSSLMPSQSTVLEAVLRLQPGGDPVFLKKIMNGHIARRRHSQPLEYPNAGSIFRNPPGDSAGRLIQEAGWSGYQIGDAQVSDKHANFIVNLGNAKANDVIRLIKAVQTDIMAKYGIELEPEIRIIKAEVNS